jgi:hypothetical protein
MSAESHDYDIDSGVAEKGTRSAPVPHGAAVYLGVVQFFFATTWIFYVIYLPQLATQAGIGREWIPWILVVDQAIFAIMDVVTGFWVDRVRAGLARFGGWILAISAVSCVAFLFLPFVGANAVLLLLLIFAWTISSSALRSPPWALLARYAAAPAVPWLSTLVLTGTAVAAALGPYLGVALREIDPRVPFVVSSLTLLATVAGIVYLERRLDSAAPAPPGEAEPSFDLRSARGTLLVAVVFSGLFLMAAGFQVHFSLNSAPRYLKFSEAGDLPYLMPLFWVGFNVLMFPSAGFVKRFGALAVMAVAGLAGSVATLAAALAPTLKSLIVAQLAAGGCWGAVNVAAFSAAIAFGRSNREGALLGTLFAVLAIAAFIRIGAYASDLAVHPAFTAVAPWLPVISWAIAALAIAATLIVAKECRI